MFDWVWTFLYLISKTLFKIIDGLVLCANYLCGINPVTVDGKEVDFLEYILTSDQISFAFSAAALLGLIIVVIFSIIAILRTLAKEKAEGTPAQIVGKAIKSILSFLFIPLIMIVLVNAGNVFMKAMYAATLQGESSLGDFLFKAFAMESGVAESAVDAFLADPVLDWRNTDDVWGLMDLSEFEFIFSWIACSVILAAIGMSMIYFVRRVIEITILYIAAPFSIGVCVLDDGARFKLWRDQILTKFITGYGMMIAINVFAMVCLLVMNPTLVFFEKGSFVDYLMKLLLITGGGVALKQSMALIGNLVSSGAGSNELRDTALAGGLTGLAGKVIPGAALASAIGGSLKQEVSGRAAQAILPSWAQRSYGNNRRNNSAGGGANGGDDKGSGSHNSNSPNFSSNGNTAKNSISALGSNTNDDKKNNSSINDNLNKESVNGNGTGNSLVSQAINNDKNKRDYDDLYE